MMGIVETGSKFPTIEAFSLSSNSGYFNPLFIPVGSLFSIYDETTSLHRNTDP
jgi:hypothetical protein